MMPTERVQPTSDFRGRYFDAKDYELAGAGAFARCCVAGMRPEHHVVEFQCNSLALGRYLMMYLQPGKYTGVAGEQPCIMRGIDDVGAEMVLNRRPRFLYDMSEFGQSKYLRKWYDFFVCWTLFQFATPSMIHLCLEQFRKVMNAESLIIGAYYEHDVSIYPSNDHANGFTWPSHVGYSRRQLESIFTGNGFSQPEELCGKDSCNPLQLTWFKSRYLGAYNESHSVGQ